MSVVHRSTANARAVGGAFDVSQHAAWVFLHVVEHTAYISLLPQHKWDFITFRLVRRV
jgi:hypothetical protein